MSFEDLEIKIKLFFLTYQKKQLLLKKEKIKSQIFSEKKSRLKFVIPFLKGKKTMVLGSLFLGFFLTNTFIIHKPFAGEITPNGPIEIIRGKKSILINEKFTLLKGDKIKVGSKKSAEILLENQITRISPQTNIHITNNNEIFLSKGKIHNNTQTITKTYTDNAIIQSQPGSIFEITVSKSGQSSITPTQNPLTIYDLNNSEITLQSGEYLTISSDTILAEKPSITDISLSNTQITSIQSKLIIARTKAIKAIEAHTHGKIDNYEATLKSAEKSFKSITQVLLSSRELEIYRRKNLETISLNYVTQTIQKRIKNQELIKEIIQIENLLSVLKQNHRKFSFAPETTPIPQYNKYITLLNIESLANLNQLEKIKPIKKDYQIDLLNKVQNIPLKIDQISELNQIALQLPKNPNSKLFLQELSQLLPQDIKELFQAKIKQLYQ